MNFPLILSISSLAVGGITYATIQSQNPVESHPEPVLTHQLLTDRPVTPRVDPVVRRDEARLEMAASDKDQGDRITTLESRIAELEAENKRLRSMTDSMQLANKLVEGDAFAEMLAEAGKQAQVHNLGTLLRDPAAILGLASEADKARYQEILKAHQERWLEAVRAHSRDETKNDQGWSINVVEPFPEEGARLREDLRYELEALNPDPEKVDQALEALGPRYNNWGQSETRSMTMSGKALGLSGADGDQAEVQMMFHSDLPTPKEPPSK